MVLLNGWKFMNQSLISPFWTRVSFRKGRKKYFLKYFNLNINVNVKKFSNERYNNKLFKNFF